MIKSRRAALSLILLGGCSSEIPGELRLPRCEPRSHLDPARLNIDSTAKDFGLADSCRASIRFYIADTAQLRVIEGKIAFSDIDGVYLRSDTFALEFTSTRGGMFSETVDPAPLEGHRCRGVLAHLSELECRDEAGRAIECPSVRLKTSDALEDFTIETGELDVCFD